MKLNKSDLKRKLLDPEIKILDHFSINDMPFKVAIYKWKEFNGLEIPLPVNNQIEFRFFRQNLIGGRESNFTQKEVKRGMREIVIWNTDFPTIFSNEGWMEEGIQKQKESALFIGAHCLYAIIQIDKNNTPVNIIYKYLEGFEDDTVQKCRWEYARLFDLIYDDQATAYEQRY